MDEHLKPVLSRITIFDKPLICPTCQHDVFTPYEMHANVEKPGIKCIFVYYCAPCEKCGYILEFNDPSYYNHEQDNFIWAFEQEWLYPPEPEPFVLAELSAEDIAFKTKNSARILAFLIEKNKLEPQWLTAFELGQYKEITLAVNANLQVPYEHLDIRHCFIALTLELVEHGYITPDQIITLAMLEEDYDACYEQLLDDALK